MSSMSTAVPPRRGPGRPREFDMDRVLDDALLVFRERGYHAASLGDLGAAMKLTPGSIYKAFADKRTIFLAAFDRYTRLRSERLQAALDKERMGIAKLRALMRLYADASHGIEGRRGCLVAGSATDLITFDSEIAGRITGALRRLDAMLHDLIVLGQSDGSIPPGINPKGCARTLLCILQGLRVAGKTGQTRAEAMAVVDQAMRLLA